MNKDLRGIGGNVLDSLLIQVVFWTPCDLNVVDFFLDPNY